MAGASMSGEAQADLYREYAKECLRIAQIATDETERARWVAMAQHWLQWADELRRGLPTDKPDN